MNFDIPSSLKAEHEALHEELRRATQSGAEIGEAAQALARLMHPHFVKEDEIALPPLGLRPRWRAARQAPAWLTCWR